MKLLTVYVCLLVLLTVQSLKFYHVQKPKQNRERQPFQPHANMKNKYDGFYPILGINLWQLKKIQKQIDRQIKSSLRKFQKQRELEERYKYKLFKQKKQREQPQENSNPTNGNDLNTNNQLRGINPWQGMLQNVMPQNGNFGFNFWNEPQIAQKRRKFTNNVTSNGDAGTNQIQANRENQMKPPNFLNGNWNEANNAQQAQNPNTNEPTPDDNGLHDNWSNDPSKGGWNKQYKFRFNNNTTTQNDSGSHEKWSISGNRLPFQPPPFNFSKWNTTGWNSSNSSRPHPFGFKGTPPTTLPATQVAASNS